MQRCLEYIMMIFLLFFLAMKVPKLCCLILSCWLQPTLFWGETSRVKPALSPDPGHRTSARWSELCTTSLVYTHAYLHQGCPILTPLLSWIETYKLLLCDHWKYTLKFRYTTFIMLLMSHDLLVPVEAFHFHPQIFSCGLTLY